MSKVITKSSVLSSNRLKGIGILRIAFGIVFAIDAWFKWQPGFISSFASNLTGALDSQPAFVQTWLHFWIAIIQVNPTLFAYLQALGETAIAIGLIFGLFSNLTDVVGIILMFLVWATAEGFGGPYQSGATDIGTAIIYMFVLAGFFLSHAGLYYGVDKYLSPRLGRFSFLASGRAQPQYVEVVVPSIKEPALS